MKNGISLLGTKICFKLIFGIKIVFFKKLNEFTALYIDFI